MREERIMSGHGNRSKVASNSKRSSNKQLDLVDNHRQHGNKSESSINTSSSSGYLSHSQHNILTNEPQVSYFYSSSNNNNNNDYQLQDAASNQIQQTQMGRSQQAKYQWQLRNATNVANRQPPMVPMMIDDDDEFHVDSSQIDPVSRRRVFGGIDEPSHLIDDDDKNYNNVGDDDRNQSTALLLRRQQLQLQASRERRRKTKSISQVHAFDDDDDDGDDGDEDEDDDPQDYSRDYELGGVVDLAGQFNYLANENRLQQSAVINPNDFYADQQNQNYFIQHHHQQQQQQPISFQQYHTFTYQPSQDQNIKTNFNWCHQQQQLELYNQANRIINNQSSQENNLSRHNNSNISNFQSDRISSSNNNNNEEYLQHSKEKQKIQLNSKTTTLNSKSVKTAKGAKKKNMQHTGGSRHLTQDSAYKQQQQQQHSTGSSRRKLQSSRTKNNKMHLNNANNQELAIGCCGKLAKLLLFAANVLFWLAGIALGAWGILSLVDDHKYNISQLLVFDPSTRMSLFQLLSWSFITLGCATILVGFCGCSALLKNNRWILGLYIFLILAIFALDLATGLLAIIFQERLVANVRLRLGNKLRAEYGVQASFTAAIDYIQTRYECCGLEGHFDYDQSLWRLQRLGGFEATVARTCCHLRNTFDDQAHINPRPVNESMCQSTDVRFHQSYRYRKGCLDDLERLVRHKIWNFTLGCAAVGAIILTSLFFATCFCRAIPRSGSRRSSNQEKQQSSISNHHQQRQHHHMPLKQQGSNLSNMQLASQFR